jgi:DNA-directed RNA polymerase specialized sigma24 family protein
MDSDNVFKQVIHDKILDFQATEDKDIFEHILIRVDNLVMHTVHLCRTKCPHLLGEDLDALYQTALLGLYKAIKSYPSFEDPDRVLARLSAYMRQEIRSSFPYRVLSDDYIESQDQFVSEETVYADLDFQMLEEFLSRLVEQEIVSQQELDLIVARYKNEIPCSMLAATHDLSEATVRTKIHDGLTRIRFQLRKRGILET